jgi:hypothetical protein
MDDEVMSHSGSIEQGKNAVHLDLELSTVVFALEVEDLKRCLVDGVVDKSCVGFDGVPIHECAHEIVAGDGADVVFHADIAVGAFAEIDVLRWVSRLVARGFDAVVLLKLAVAIAVADSLAVVVAVSSGFLAVFDGNASH